MKMNTVCLALTLFILLAFGCKQSKMTEHLVTCDEVEQLRKDHPDLVILDVRTPAETREGTLGDVVELDFYAPDFVSKLTELDDEKPYLVYCRSGKRSANARATMLEIGIETVYDLKGGYMNCK